MPNPDPRHVELHGPGPALPYRPDYLRRSVPAPEIVRRQLEQAGVYSGLSTAYDNTSICRHRRTRAGRWLNRHRGDVAAATAIGLVAGYAAAIGMVFVKYLPTPAAAWWLGAAGVALVLVLIAVCRWARR